MVEKLHIMPSLEADLRAHVAPDNLDAALALRSFMTVVWGTGETGHPPLYQGAARRAWQVTGLEGPPAELHVFDWGGDNLGVPALRVWHLIRPGSPPRGIGAFRAVSAPGARERGALRTRVRALLGAPACDFVEAESDENDHE